MKYTLVKTATFDLWLTKLNDPVAKRAILLRLMRAENGHMGDVKSVGAAVQEMRIFVSKGYRVYFTVRGSQLILLLNGGHKDSQQQDIAKAHALLAELED